MSQFKEEESEGGEVDDFFSGFEEFIEQPETDDEYFTNQAWFCANTGMSWKDYDDMTLEQINAWVKVYKKINKRNR